MQLQYTIVVVNSITGHNVIQLLQYSNGLWYTLITGIQFPWALSVYNTKYKYVEICCHLPEIC